MYLRDRSGSTGSCWSRIKTIAADLGLSRSTVKRAPNDLVDKGYLLKEERHRPNGSYNLKSLYASIKSAPFHQGKGALMGLSKRMVRDEPSFGSS